MSSNIALATRINVGDSRTPVKVKLTKEVTSIVVTFEMFPQGLILSGNGIVTVKWKPWNSYEWRELKFNEFWDEDEDSEEDLSFRELIIFDPTDKNFIFPNGGRILLDITSHRENKGDISLQVYSKFWIAEV